MILTTAPPKQRNNFHTCIYAGERNLISCQICLFSWCTPPRILGDHNHQILYIQTAPYICPFLSNAIKSSFYKSCFIFLAKKIFLWHCTLSRGSRDQGLHRPPLLHIGRPSEDFVCNANFLISTKGAFRRPMTYDDHPSHPIQHFFLSIAHHSRRTRTFSNELI